MDLNKATLVCCLTLFIVIGVNAAIYGMIRKNGFIGQIDLFRKAASRARQPWHDEEESLKELSKRVNELRPGSIQEISQDNHFGKT